MKSRFMAAFVISTCLFASTAVADAFLIVTTSSNVGGAGTDSNIYVRLTDADSTSKRLRLQDLVGAGGNILESGSIGIFAIADDELTTGIVSIQVESDGLYSGADWHLESIRAVSGPKDLLLQAMIRPYAPPPAGVFSSTFLAEKWIKGDEDFLAGGEKQPGVLLVRKEPVAKTEGAARTAETSLFIVYSADALDSDQPVERAWETTISRHDSMTLTDGRTDQVSIGTVATVGYAASQNTGGATGSVSLSAEYQFVKNSIRDEVWGKDVSSATNDTFEAVAGTIQFRILTTPGVVAEQDFNSLIQNKWFKGLYVQEASPFVPMGVTFTKGTLGDEKWNRSVARAVAVTQGKGGYDQIVNRLKKFGILKEPLPYEDALNSTN